MRSLLVPAANTPTAIPRKWWLLFALVCLGKLALVSHEEILLYGSDDTGWVDAASGFYWGNPYQPYSYARQPVYPIFLAMTEIMGVPTRIAIEWVLFLCVGIAAQAMRRCGGSVAAITVATVLLIFQPWHLRLSTRIIVDTFYAPVFMVLVLATAAALACRSTKASIRWGIVAGVAAAVTANTRQEAVLTYGVGVLAAAFALLQRWSLDRSDRRLWTPLAGAVLIPLGLALTATHGLRAASSLTIGAYVTYDFELPGYRALYRTLLAIPPDQPSGDLRLVVTKEVRERAARVSPATKRLFDAVAASSAAAEYAAECKRQTGVDGEYGAWLCWALRHGAWSVAQARGPVTARTIDDVYREAADELRAAMQAGRLKQRWAPFTFVAPEWRLIGERLPPSLYKCVDLFCEAVIGQDKSRVVTPDVEARFNAVCGRRITESRWANDGRAPGGSIWVSERVCGTIRAVKRALEHAWPHVSRPLIGLVLAGGLAALVRMLRRSLSDRWFFLYGLLLSAMAARFAMVALLDAAGIPCQPRYLLVNSYLMIVCATIAGQMVLHASWQAVRSSNMPIGPQDRINASDQRSRSSLGQGTGG